MRLSIRNRLALLCTLSIVSVVVVVTILQVAETRRSAREAVSASQFALVSAVAGTIDKELEFRRVAVEKLATVVPVDATRNLAAGRRFLEGRPVARSMFESLFLVSADGKVIADWPPRPERIGNDINDRRYFAEIRDKNRGVISEPVRGRTNGRPQVVFAAPILGERGEFLGALLGSVDLLSADVTAGLATQSIGKTGYFFMMAHSPTLTMVSHPDRARIMQPVAKPNPLTQRALEGWEGSEETTSTQGVRGLYSYKRLKSTGWLVVAVFPADEAFAPIEAGQVRMAAIGLGASILFGLLTWLLVTRLLRPLERLRTEIGRGIREPDYVPQPASRREDELGELSREFSELMRQRAELNAALAEANATLDAKIEQKTVDLRKQADEMERFLYTLGHDLRSPIRAVGAYSELVLREHSQGLDQDARRMLQRCVENGRHMGELIDGMLELGRISRLTVGGAELARVDMRQAVADAIARLHVPPGVDLRVGSLPPALAEPHLVAGVLHALIDNALKFSAQAAAPRIEIGGEARDGEVVYTVQDNGVGFDMQYADSLFKPFSRLHIDQGFPGVGAGLAIAKRSVEVLGGRIWAGSVPGKGARFCFGLKPAA